MSNKINGKIRKYSTASWHKFGYIFPNQNLRKKYLVDKLLLLNFRYGIVIRKTYCTVSLSVTKLCFCSDEELEL